MTFKAIDARPGARAEPVLFSLRSLYSKRMVRISFTPAFISRLGWQLGTHLTPMVGSGPDEGLIRIVPSPSTARGFLLRKVPKASRLRLEFVLKTPEPKWKSCEPEYHEEFSTRSLTIRLPWSDKGTQRRAAE